MSSSKDTYQTIEVASDETLFKDKNSKFFGYAFPVFTEEDIKACLEKVRKKHHAARHYCYAWQLGTEAKRFRANDDGEPNNTAGMPIYGQIQAFEVTNILIVSVRYFGGVKLGVGGLINAYRSSAKLALEVANIVKKTINIEYLLCFDYDMMNKVQRIIKERKIKIIDQKLALACEYVISVRKKESEAIYTIFDTLFKVGIKKV